MVPMPELLMCYVLLRYQASCQASSFVSEPTSHGKHIRLAPLPKEYVRPSGNQITKVEPGHEVDKLAKQVKPSRPNVSTYYQVQSRNQDVKHKASMYLAQKDAEAMYHNPDLPSEIVTAANVRFH